MIPVSNQLSAGKPSSIIPAARFPCGLLSHSGPLMRLHPHLPKNIFQVQQ